jgi:subtilisin
MEHKASALSILSLLLLPLMLYGCTQFDLGVETSQDSTSLAQAARLDRYIVVLRDDMPSTATAVVARQLRISHGLGLGQIYEHAFKGFSATVPAGRLAALSRDPRVDFVQLDSEVQVFGSLDFVKAQDHSPGEIPTGVNRFDAELNANTASGVNVAVLDTGIHLTHPDLHVKSGKNCTGRGSPTDGNGHGSHVAGTIGAKDNGSGVVGVAPGVTLWAVKVLDNSGSGYISWIICGIDWVTSTRTDTSTSNDIAVANLSLGGSGWDDNNCGYSNRDALHRAICRSVDRGVVYVVAAGNSTKDAKNFTPAAYNEVITVSAIADYDGTGGGGAAPTCSNYGPDDSFAAFSNFGEDVDLAAPGVCIKSTYKNGGYAVGSGTSMASPHVAGLAALYVKSNGLCTTKACVLGVRDALINAAKPQTDPNCGFSGDPDGFAEPLAYANASTTGGTGTGNCQ